MMAVKIVSKRQPTDRLKTEVLIQQSLRHENIIRLFETFQDPEYFYIIMELGAGGELFDKIGTSH
jgi:serine/threonine-protein kinase Chk1